MKTYEIVGVYAMSDRMETYEAGVVDVLEMAHDEGYTYVAVSTLASMVGAPVNGSFMQILVRLQAMGIIVMFRTKGAANPILVCLYDTVDFNSAYVGKMVDAENVL